MSIDTATVSDVAGTTFRTVEYVARVLDVDPKTIRQWIRTKRMRAIKLPGKAGYRITDAQLQAYLGSLQGGPNAS